MKIFLKSQTNVYFFFIFIAFFYVQNILRYKANSLNQRISIIQDMKAYYQNKPSTFKGNEKFYILKKPLALCGMVGAKKIVLELTDLEILNVYEETNKYEIPFSYHDQYVIKKGKLLVSGASVISRKINEASFYQDEQDIFLVNPSVMLTNSNCYRAGISL